jgi:hypothetical protein
MNDVRVAGDFIQVLIRAKALADGEQAFSQTCHRDHALLHDARCVVMSFMRERC